MFSFLFPPVFSSIFSNGCYISTPTYSHQSSHINSHPTRISHVMTYLLTRNWNWFDFLMTAWPWPWYDLSDVRLCPMSVDDSEMISFIEDIGTALLYNDPGSTRPMMTSWPCLRCQSHVMILRSPLIRSSTHFRSFYRVTRRWNIDERFFF